MEGSGHLIIGCGFLGSRFLHLLQQQPCWFTSRSSTATSEFSKHQPLLLDINIPTSWSALTRLRQQPDLCVYLMVPPSKIDINTFPAFLQELDQLQIKRRILVSSSVVYGQTDRIVYADSEVCLDSKRAQRQFDIEQVWMQNNDRACIVRLAGLYGPTRIIGKQAISDAQTLPGNPLAWLNLIHVDDAATLVKCITEQNNPAAIELGCDGQPIQRQQYYSMLAKLMHCPIPVFQDKPDNEHMGRRCSSEVTITRTGWRPTHTDVQQVLMKELNNEQ